MNGPPKLPPLEHPKQPAQPPRALRQRFADLGTVVVDPLHRQHPLGAGKPPGAFPMRDRLGLHAEVVRNLETGDESLPIHASPPTQG